MCINAIPETLSFCFCLIPVSPIYTGKTVFFSTDSQLSVPLSPNGGGGGGGRAPIRDSRFLFSWMSLSKMSVLNLEYRSC